MTTMQQVCCRLPTVDQATHFEQAATTTTGDKMQPPQADQSDRLRLRFRQECCCCCPTPAKLLSRPQAASCSVQAKPKHLLLVQSVALPLMLLLVLPSLRLSPKSMAADTAATTITTATSTAYWVPFLLNLARLPFERLHFSSFGLLQCAEASFYATGAHQVDPLLPEESHLPLISPASGVGHYRQSSGLQHHHQHQQQQQQHQQQRKKNHAVEPPPPPPPPQLVEALHAGASSTGGYPGGYLGDQQPLEPGQGYPSVVNADAGGQDIQESRLGGSQQVAVAAAQRSDLPGVRALNVKCERDHMTVSRSSEWAQ